MLALLLAGCHERVPPEPPADVVATVNGQPITVGQLRRALMHARRDDANLSPRTKADKRAIRRTTLQDLINQALLLQAARAAKIVVAPEAVDREVLRMRADYPGQSFDEALAEGGTTREEFREQARRRLTIEEYFVQQVYARVAVTDADVDAYYKAHPEQFAHPEQVHVEQILVSDPDTAKRILAEIRSGKSFEEMARKYSISPDAKVGGDLGFFSRGVMPEVFDTTCFNLRPGQVSEVVASPYGYHLFKLLEKRSAGTPALSDIRPRVEATLRKQREQKAQKAALDALRAKAQIKIDEKVLAAVP